MHWDEFNYAVLETIFEGDLMREAQKKRSNFPHYPHLDEDIDLRLAKEEPITRSLINKWNYTIVAVSLREVEGAFHPCLWREKAGKKLSIGKLPSPVAPGTEGQESKRSRQPDGGSMLLGEIVLKRPGKGSRKNTNLLPTGIARSCVTANIRTRKQANGSRK
ncbi:hypothetical protein F4801DRAFT_601729 [Xylaria longipes]|nr:hypothetical protein F4801DRAFT_601729 [Xylaria longipes]